MRIKSVLQISFFGFLLIFFGCTKEVVSPPFEEAELTTSETFVEGYYVGLFSVYYVTHDSTVSDTTWINFEKGNYTNPGNSSFLPQGGTGEYTYESDSLYLQTIFAMQGYEDPNKDTTGHYKYTQEGSHL